MSQITTRDLLPPLVASIAAQVLEEMSKEPRLTLVAVKEEEFAEAGNGMNVGSPVNRSDGYDKRPG